MDQGAKAGAGYRSNGRTGERPFAQYWPFPASSCCRAVNQKNREFEVGTFGSADVAKFEVPLQRAPSNGGSSSHQMLRRRQMAPDGTASELRRLGSLANPITYDFVLAECGQLPQKALSIAVVPLTYARELPAAERMEGMRYPHKTRV